MKCKHCGSTDVQMDGNRNGKQGYKCMTCKKKFTEGVFVKKYFKRFNVDIKIKDTNKLTRENYCVPTNEISYKEKKIIKEASHFIEINGKIPTLIDKKYYTIPNNVFIDEEHYTDEFVNKHYVDCIENFDLNMKYFAMLDWEEFNEYLLKFVKRNHLNEIKDLNVLKGREGVYLLVLDEYKQVYIGQSIRMKEEILKHWSSTKEFDYLLDGEIDESVLSIDSFGALDTTRIFFKCPKNDRHKVEEKLISDFKECYKLNRVPGGINAEVENNIRNLKLIAGTYKRSLKN